MVTPNHDPRIDRQLSQLFGFEHIVMAGWARSALVALIEHIAGGRSIPVVFPSNICPAVLAAVHAAGAVPHLACVSVETGLAEDDHLHASMMAAISDGASVGVVMPCHLYGVVRSYPKTVQAALKAGWCVVENDSLAATVGRGPVTGANNVLLVSFGQGKTIDARCGGAILTNDGSLADSLRKRIAEWPILSKESEAFEEHASLARRHLRALGKPNLAEGLLQIDSMNARQALPSGRRDFIAAAARGMAPKIEELRGRLRAWDKALELLNADLLVPHTDVAVPWRLIRRLRHPVLRDELVRYLRDRDIDVGTNYPPLWQSFPTLLANQSHPDGDTWGESVINLWLTSDYSGARIAHVADAIGRFFVQRKS